MDPDQRPCRLSPDLLFIVWLMAACFLGVFAVIAAGALIQLLSK